MTVRCLRLPSVTLSSAADVMPLQRAIRSLDKQRPSSSAQYRIKCQVRLRAA